jgi:cytochrome P450
MVNNVWPIIRYSTEKRISITRGEDGGFFGRGDDWKSIRNFLQTDLLSPQSAAGYIPGVIIAVELASKGAPQSQNDLNSYLNRCAFDMFCSVMFGELVRVADPSTPTEPKNLEFIENAVRFLNISTEMLLNPYETIVGNGMNFKTKMYKEFEICADVVFDISREKIRQFQKLYNQDKLDELQKQSYLANALRRRAELSDSDIVTEEMMIDICTVLLTASVDTTSGVMGWALLHISLNEDVQEKLFQELHTNVTTNETGRLSAEMFDKRSKTPYLHAVLRESHRITPSVPNNIIKQVSCETEIHGVTLPADSMLAFNNYAIQMDPIYIDDPDVFRPERWLSDAVDARKGTPKEVMDHPFFKDPFSQGSRKCPGSRVAINEVLCLLSQLVLDYKIRAPTDIVTHNDVPYTLMGVYSPILPKLEFIPRKKV